MNQAQSLNKTSNYPINTSSISNNRSIKKDYHQNKEIQDLREVSLQQLKNMQSPSKAEEITKDENGEIIKKKEEKTIIILSGQTVEPKSITETFEKPTIEVIQNED
jgi:ribosomal protein L15